MFTDLEARVSASLSRQRAQMSTYLAAEPSDDPWWKEHAGTAVTVGATALTGFAVLLSRHYCQVVGLPDNAWRVDVAPFVTMLAMITFPAVAMFVVAPMAARWLAARWTVGPRGADRRRWIRRAGWLLASCFALTVVLPQDALAAEFAGWAGYAGVIVVIAVATGRRPRIVGHLIAAVIVTWSAAGLWQSASKAGNEHAAGRPGASTFSKMLVAPKVGMLDGRCVLRISSTIFIAVDNDSANNQFNGDISLDASGPFTLGCR